MAVNPEAQSANIQHPDARALFDWARTRMTRKDCRRLAEMDDVPQVERVIRAIVESGEIPAPLMDPVEACALWRWGYEEHTSRQERIIAVFATTLMLIGSYIPGSSAQLDDGQNNSVAVMLWSVLGLEDCADEAARMLDWMESHPSVWAPWPRSFVALARLLVGVWRGEPGELIEAHAEAVVRCEEEDRSRCDVGVNEGKWRGAFILGLTNFDQTHGLWVRLSRTTLEMCEPVLRDLTVAREVLERIAHAGAAEGE